MNGLSNWEVSARNLDIWESRHIRQVIFERRVLSVMLHIICRVRKAWFSNVVRKKAEAACSECHKSLVVPPQTLRLDDQNLEIKERNGTVFREGEGLQYAYRFWHVRS